MRKDAFFVYEKKAPKLPPPTLSSGPHQIQNSLELDPVPLVYLSAPNYHQGIKILTSESFSVFRKL